MSENQEIVTTPTYKQVLWLYENKPDLVEAALCDEYSPDWVVTEPWHLYAIMHKVTEAVHAKNYTTTNYGDGYCECRSIYSSKADPKKRTPFQAELAALGAPEEVVND